MLSSNVDFVLVKLLALIRDNKNWMSECNIQGLAIRNLNQVRKTGNFIKATGSREKRGCTH